MRKFVLAMSVFLTMGVGAAVAAPQPKVAICHFPPGNPANVQLISVGAPAVPAHLARHNDAVCAAGDSNCCFGGSAAPSVCTNLATDAANCGVCGVACAAGEVCSGGACTCTTAGETNCDGVCTDLGSDAANCGACGVACPNGVCSDGVCGCPTAGQTNCDGVCTDLGSDAANCGACGAPCPRGDVCSDGVCGCPTAGQTNCGGVCTDLSSDAANCGVCGAACQAGDVCSGGACGCPTTGQTDCGGVCTDTNSDPNNCGACGNVCPAGVPGTCSAGVCTACNPSAPDLPPGSYQLTCIDCSMSGCTLTCTCADILVSVTDCPGPDCPVSSLELPCSSDIANCNGLLTCAAPGGCP